MKLSMRSWVSTLVVAGLVLWAAAASASTIRVHYDTGYGNRITIRGSASPLSWTVGQAATWTTGNVWTLTWPNTSGDVEVKPLFNDSTWSVGANYKVKAGATVDVYPFFGSQSGSIVKVNNFYSPQLNNSRTLAIYLPPSYQENSLKRYPVLYMHDGQNLFDASTSAFGVEWQVDENANGLIRNGQMDEVIVVGIYNNANRIWEYTPCCDSSYGGGGADTYEQFLINTVKPYIDQTYRTISTKANTAIMGSSLGGLVSCYIARRHPEVFAKTGCMSSSFWWNNQAFTVQVEQATTKPAVKFYIDAGTSNDGLPETTRMNTALRADGYVQGTDLNFYTAQGGSHNEASWAARVYIPLTWLFAWQSTAY